MIELCDQCGAVQAPGAGPCACVAQPTDAAPAEISLELDIDRDHRTASVRPSNPSASMHPGVASLPPPTMSGLPPPMGGGHRGLPSFRPLPPQPSRGPLIIKLSIIGALVLGLPYLLLYVGRTFGLWTLTQAKEAATRPYPSPNRLVIAAVLDDYGSEATEDGSLLLRQVPAGAAAGLAGMRGGDVRHGQAALERGIGGIKGGTYRALEPPEGRCRSDGEELSATLGEITFPERTVRIWSCTLMKKGFLYFLVWAVDVVNAPKEMPRLMYMLKSSQLRTDDLCAMGTIINGGCTPDLSGLVQTVVARALGRP